ncbi:hypothetical protein DPEC_G00283760 [Dallia pectoralis]|uniref:Uncharacterized protein n=1 Tax=Dallia pectoralis TaxID=75939 RepID=A0ACC2FJA4_DALPE|nr:hypothetical protein DPEC_G00283760 [Dallia pectoralis]
MMKHFLFSQTPLKMCLVAVHRETPASLCPLSPCVVSVNSVWAIDTFVQSLFVQQETCITTTVLALTCTLDACVQSQRQVVCSCY